MMDGEIHRCAVGCLLSAEGLSETVTVNSELLQLRELMGGVGSFSELGFQVPELANVNLDFLDLAQDIHDSESNWENGVFDVAKLDALAWSFGLAVVTEAEWAPQEDVMLV